jgi:hypothetical protein
VLLECLNSVLRGTELSATLLDSIIEGPSCNEDPGKAIHYLSFDHSCANNVGHGDFTFPPYIWVCI